MTIATTVAAIERAASWDDRVRLVRQVPESYGMAQHQIVYATIAEQVYKPHLSAMFAYVPWREEYELRPFQEAYRDACQQTEGFTKASDEDLREALLNRPSSLRIFRMLLGYTADELAAAVTVHLAEVGLAQQIGKGRINGIELGRAPSRALAGALAEVINRLVTGVMWAEAEEPLRPKLAKPDTTEGWELFAHPVQANQRRYEALRAYLYQGASLDQAAGRFGYIPPRWTRWPATCARDADPVRRTGQARPQARPETGPRQSPGDRAAPRRPVGV